MHATASHAGIIRLWQAKVSEWAKSMPPTPDKQAVLAWLPLWQNRPFYTAAELAPIFPALALALGYADTLQAPRSPKSLANRLTFFRLLTLRNIDDSDIFVHPVTGRNERFFVVENIRKWTQRPVSQEEFEREFAGPTQR